jgi:HTH-type transcriptional regulator, sugar sensing transcriptional regulator
MIKALEEIGFSLNEAKAYVTLTNNKALNGYEIAKHAQIPRSMVYEVINRLIMKKAITLISTDPNTYAAVHYKEVLQNYQEDQKVKLNRVQKLFEEFTNPRQDDNYVLNLPSHELLIKETKNAILLAEKEILISIWDHELNEYTKELVDAEKRGIDIRIFSFNKISSDIGKQYTYDIPDIEEIFQRRRSIFVVDKKKLYIGEWNNITSQLSIYTKNEMLINVAVDLMMLDVMMYYTLITKGDFVPGMSSSEYQNKLNTFFIQVSENAMKRK